MKCFYEIFCDMFGEGPNLSTLGDLRGGLSCLVSSNKKATSAGESLPWVESEEHQRIMMVRGEAISALECLTSQWVNGGWWIQHSKNSESRNMRVVQWKWPCQECSCSSLAVQHEWVFSEEDEMGLYALLDSHVQFYLRHFCQYPKYNKGYVFSSSFYS